MLLNRSLTSGQGLAVDVDEAVELALASALLGGLGVVGQAGTGVVQRVDEGERARSGGTSGGEVACVCVWGGESSYTSGEGGQREQFEGPLAHGTLGGGMHGRNSACSLSAHPLHLSVLCQLLQVSLVPPLPLKLTHPRTTTSSHPCPS